MSGDMNVLIAGGGTGGHLFPALAIGEEIQHREPEANIHFVGSTFGLEAKVFPIKDVWHTLLPIRGLQRGFNFRSLGRNILLPGRVIHSLIKLKTLFREFSPGIIIGTGGYVSALPLYVASRKKEPIPIVLQEQNSFPGVTTRWFSEKARKICVAFQDAENQLNTNTILTGNPVRQGIMDGNKLKAVKEFRLDPEKKTVFLFGGSQGSAFLNQIMNKVVNNIAAANIQVLWQTGDKEYDLYNKKDSENVRLIPFINNMANAYILADLIICRSGALTLAEVTVCGKPSILVPFAAAAGDHQTKNAQALVNAGAARILFEKNLKPQEFYHTIMNLIHSKAELDQMADASKKLGRPHATQDIVDHIMELAA